MDAPRIRTRSRFVAMVWGIVVVLLMCAAPAAAQTDEPVVEPDPKVVELNEEGVKKVVIGELDAAIALFEQSLEVQELNVTWMNLGRALQHANRCEEARKAYEKALSAPRVAEPAYQDVVKAIFEYRTELDDSCKEAGEATAENRGQSDGGEVADAGTDTDGGADTGTGTGDEGGAAGDGDTGDGQDGTVVAGDTTGDVDGASGATDGAADASDESTDTTDTTDTAPEDEQTALVDTDASGSEGDADDEAGTAGSGSAPQPPPADPAGPSYSPWSWIALGVGVAALGSMVAIELGVLSPKFDDLDAASTETEFDDIAAEIETMQAVNISLLAVGSAAVVTGTVLVILDLTADAPESDMATELGAPSLAVGADGASVGWRLEW